MCLYIRSYEMVAKKDMAVYKVISTDNHSIHQRFVYEPNTLYRLRKKLKVDDETFTIDVSDSVTKTITHKKIDEGFHAYVDVDEPKTQYCLRIASRIAKVVEFTIPKGAKYYLGDNGDIVSSSIRSGNLKKVK